MSEIRFLRNICNVYWQTIDENLPNNDLSKIVFERNEKHEIRTNRTKSNVYFVKRMRMKDIECRFIRNLRFSFD